MAYADFHYIGRKFLKRALIPLIFFLEQLHFLLRYKTILLCRIQVLQLVSNDLEVYKLTPEKPAMILKVKNAVTC